MQIKKKDQSLPGPSGLHINRKIVDYSDSDQSSETEIKSQFLKRPIQPRSLRIYSFSSPEPNINSPESTIKTATMESKTVSEKIAASTVQNSSDEDDVPLAELCTKTEFQNFMPTPDYGSVKIQPRKKALNYKDQRVTQDLFNKKEEEMKKTKKGKPKVKETKSKCNTNTKTIDKSAKKKTGKNAKKSEERWYCHACHEENDGYETLH